MAAAVAAASSSEIFFADGVGGIAAVSVSLGVSALDMAGQCRVVPPCRVVGLIRVLCADHDQRHAHFVIRDDEAARGWATL